MLRGGEADVRRFRSGADRTTAYQERRVGSGYVAVVGAGKQLYQQYRKQEVAASHAGFLLYL